uniref:Uncharacterized protein n=1 Tax=Saimiri boliviensis boliviensis TaxID=39432 RepID=A0A2K6SS94_SAIBB
MARDLIGPALPPGFKARGTAEDEERDPSPGKRRRLRSPPGLSTRSLAGLCLGGRRGGEWAWPDPRELFFLNDSSRETEFWRGY